jgi:hypothetical protein
MVPSHSECGTTEGASVRSLLEHRFATYDGEQRMVFAATTYRAFAEMLAASGEGSDVRDLWVDRMRSLPTYVVRPARVMSCRARTRHTYDGTPQGGRMM